MPKTFPINQEYDSFQTKYYLAKTNLKSKILLKHGIIEAEPPIPNSNDGVD